MKTFLLALLFGFFALPVFAQSTWKAKFNDKTLLTTSVENEEKNAVVIKAGDLKKKKDFSLSYSDKTKRADWERTISVYDENDHELTSQKGDLLLIKNGQLQSFFKNSKKLKIYTIALPADPKLRAVIRVRRVHLCTLVLQ